MLLFSLLQIVNNPTDSIANAVNAMPVGTAPTQATLSLFDLLMKGGWVMIPLGLLFFLALYFFIERLLAVSRTPKVDGNFIFNLKDMLANGNIDAARSLCKHSNTPQSFMIEKGLLRLGKPIKEIEEAMQGVAQQELYRLEKNLAILSIAGRVAPMMGFIGTIMGVINIFYKISLAKTVEIDVISEGLYQKMISSASGLVVGIFAFICFYIVQMMVDKRVNAMEKTALDFIDILYEPNKK